MKNSVLQEVDQYARAHMRKKRWYRVVTCLAAVVVFCTTYALILPAITMEGESCGIPEHIHEESCYAQVESASQRVPICTAEGLHIHTHTPECYDETGALICGYADFVVHEHDDSCYDEDGTLWCPLPEIKAHEHQASCYAKAENGEEELVCGEEEILLHQHTADCYDENGERICGKTEVLEHIHSDSCFEEAEETSGVLICGMEEHTHSAACYADPTADVESAGVWERTLKKENLTGEWPQDVIAIAQTQLGYAESTRNYVVQEEGKTLQGYTRYGEWYGDPYGQWDAMFVSFCLHYAGVENMPLEADCEAWVQKLQQEPYKLYHPVDLEEVPCAGNLIFFSRKENGQADHVGLMTEWIAATEKEPAKIKVIEGDCEDKVQIVTYEWGDPTILGYSRLPEQTFYCGKSGHVHEEACRDEQGQLICGLEEHIHDDSCKVSADSPEQETLLTEKTFVGADYTVRVQYDKDAGLPRDVTLVVSEIPAGSEAYSRYYQQALAAMADDGTAETVLFARFFDIQFQVDGEKVEPAAPVSVTITYSQPVEADGEGQAIHFTEDGTEILEAMVEKQEDGSVSFTHTQNGFSVVGDVMTLDSTEPAGTSTSHKVTYKVMIDGKWQEVGEPSSYYSDDSQRAYITSDMAAKALASFGYSAGMDPRNHFAYSYDDIYTIFYVSGGSVTNFCMDVDGGKIENNQAIQLWTSNNSDAQVFRIWDAGDGYSYITPIGNSTYHINVLGSGTTDGTKLGLHTATDAASHWKVVKNGDGTTSFYNRNAPNTACIDLPSGTQTKGNQLHIWTNGANRYWKLDQQYRVSNQIAITENGGSYQIGLTTESNGDIVCYYLPLGYTGTLTDVNENAMPADNGFYSVRVVDDGQYVYKEEAEINALNETIPYVQHGGAVTVSVRNGDGILWSCVGKDGEPLEVESKEEGGATIFTIQNVTQPVEITATKANPAFTVQYYGNIPRFATSGDNALKVIDTSGKALPTNGGSMATRSLYLEGTGQYTHQNKGNATQLYRIKTVTELTKLYTEQTCQFEESPGLEYFDKLRNNESYTLKEIWVLKSGKDPASVNRDDWEIYSYSSDIGFTNEAGLANEGTILIRDGGVIRLVSDTSTGAYYNGTTFYDYNISSGQNSDGRWRTGITGINIEKNYGTSLNGERNWRSGADILAFGNANCGTGMSGYLFDGSTLNKHSSKNNGYGGATFGLASGLNNDGTIRYNDLIVAPKLFNDGDANGKQTYAGSSLTFDRVGDTYTLSAATLNNSNGQSNTLSGLQYFFNPSPVSGKIHTDIFTNNFWPMDPAAGRTDPLWGTYGNPGTFKGFVESNSYKWTDLATDFPVSDDGQAHNWFFGMNFAITFNLTADYEGPLEYYFFGDDDLWVFLDGKLVCDIGGVHSSIGEYVNLRDYLPVGSSGQHTLTFFYTERGASGSTCYMSFTLPSVSSSTTSRDTGSLQIEKKVESTDGVDYSGQDYQFKVDLLTEENGSPLNQTFSYSRSDGTYGTVRSGGVITLKQNETVTINGIPAGTFYQVEETSHEGYHTTVNGNKGYIVSGKIETGAVKPANFVNTPYYELPETGGGGIILYTAGGLLLMLAAGGLLFYKHLKRRKEDFISS